MVHVLGLGERVGRGAEVDLEARPGRLGHAVVGQQPHLRRVLRPRERRQVRLDGRQRPVVRRSVCPVARPDRVGDDGIGRDPALDRAPVRQEV